MKKRPPDPRRRHLSKEDEALWEAMAGTLKPLERAKARVHPPATPLEERGAALHGKHPGEPGPAHAEPHRAAPGPSASAPESPALNLFDRKAARRLRQGRIEIEARVDLHGLRQSEAHTRLVRFLHACHAKGQRWVLVITGKGATRRRDDGESGFASHFERQEPGVLKRNVPHWLAEPELRAIIVSFTTAAISHGGEGALYVQLRNPERTKGTR